MKKLLMTLVITTLLSSSAYSQEHAATTKSYSPYAGSDPINQK